MFPVNMYFLLFIEQNIILYVYFETQMAKSIKELKKENIFLKSKCEKSDVTLIELAEEVSLAYTPFTIETIINC